MSREDGYQHSLFRVELVDFKHHRHIRTDSVPTGRQSHASLTSVSRASGRLDSMCFSKRTLLLCLLFELCIKKSSGSGRFRRFLLVGKDRFPYDAKLLLTEDIMANIGAGGRSFVLQLPNPCPGFAKLEQNDLPTYLLDPDGSYCWNPGCDYDEPRTGLAARVGHVTVPRCSPTYGLLHCYCTPRDIKLRPVDQVVS